MFEKYESGVYTNGHQIFELDVGVGIKFRSANGTCHVMQPSLTIYFGEVSERNGMSFNEWALKNIVMDREPALKILEKSVYLGDL